MSILVLQIKGGRWVSWDPEWEFSVVDLDFADYILLDHNAVFAQDKYADIFHFEPMSQSEVGGYRKRALTFLALHGNGGAETMEQVWVISDPRDECFGVIVTQDIVDASDLIAEGGSKGIVEYEDEHRLVEQWGKSEVVDTVKKWREPTQMFVFSRCSEMMPGTATVLSQTRYPSTRRRT